MAFLTGDCWSIGFRRRPERFASVVAAPATLLQPAFDAVSLFSGGLDSLIGAIDLLETVPTSIFISHAGDAATSDAQNTLFRKLQDHYSALSFDRLRVWMAFPDGLVKDAGSESTTRGRSFLYIALGAFAGTGIGSGFVLQVPENGLIALNVPLDPLRLGSNSTRTTHPFYLARWNDLLVELGINGRIRNPYWNKTKGEMVAGCANGALLKAIAAEALSCSSPSKGRWQGRGIEHCGYCLPCLIRRAALEAAWGRGHDPTVYTLTDLRAQPLDTDEATGKQLRSFQIAVDRLRGRPDLARLLIHKPGPLTDHASRLVELADVYRRGLYEVAQPTAWKHGRADCGASMIPTSGLVDFHCHLDLYPDHSAVVRECEEAGVFTLAVTTTPKAWSRNHELAQATRHVRAALGLHPQLVAERANEVSFWEAHLAETRYVGEVGLDAGPRFYKSLDLQKHVFAHVLRCCAEASNKVITVHSVRSARSVLDKIEEYLPPSRGKVVLHWFTGSKAEAKRAIDMGCYFSINASMLRSERHLEMVASIPIERLLTETDSPFTKTAGRPSKPADVVTVVEALGNLHGISTPTIVAKIRSNLLCLLEQHERSD